MAKLLVVFGATGQQGRSIISHVLSTPSLSSQYRIRGVTRDPLSPAALSLPSAISLVRADATDPSSLPSAFAGASVAFLMTNPSFTTTTDPSTEETHGLALARAALAASVPYLIFSTLPAASLLSRGAAPHASHYDAKAAVEAFIRAQPVRSAFVSPGLFMSSFRRFPFLAPRRVATGVDDAWEIALHVPADTAVPLVDAVVDLGRFVGAVLGDLDRFDGVTLCAAERTYTLAEVVEVMGRVVGRKVVYRQCKLEELQGRLQVGKVQIPDAFSFGMVVGYYGEGTEEKVAWAGEQVGGGLMSLEEWVRREGLALE